jgi:hypothetical protein
MRPVSFKGGFVLKKIIVFFIVCFILNAVFLLGSCTTTSSVLTTTKTDSLVSDVQAGQTGITTDAVALAGTSDALVSTVTDIKDTGSATKKQIEKLVVYTDKNATLVKSLNEKVAVQTKTINDMTKSHIADNDKTAVTISALNTEIAKLKPYKSRFILSCFVIGVIALLIIGYIVLRIKKILVV